MLGLGLVLPTAFVLLGSSGMLASHIEQSRWLVEKLGMIWPALIRQQEFVFQTLGAGHAASFGLFSAVLWILPILTSIVMFIEYRKRRSEISPVSPSEMGKLIIVAAAAFLVLTLSRVGDTSSVTSFRASSSGFFYIVHYGVFAVVAVLLSALLFLLARFVTERMAKGRSHIGEQA